MLKFCPRCKTEKEINCFGIDKNSSDNHKCWCKKCFADWAKEHAESGKRWRKKNRIKILQQLSIRRKENIHFKVKSCLRARLNDVLKKGTKFKPTLELLGCSIEFLKRHLESQFTVGMNWSNHGKGDNGKKEWQIDHVIPCIAFDLSKPEEQYKCFHYTNLQPLWASDNKSKYNKFFNR
jgi:hypothetical protein